MGSVQEPEPPKNLEAADGVEEAGDETVSASNGAHRPEKTMSLSSMGRGQ